MKARITSKNGTVLTEDELEYRKVLIADSRSVFCPVTHKLLLAMEGEIIFCNGSDYFVSDEGIERLKSIFGEQEIMERIITYD